MEKEEWKPVKDYEGLYEVSNLGNVKSLKLGKEKILKLSVDGAGYLRCNLSLNGIAKQVKAHQLVAMAFLNHTPCGFKLVVDHINDDKLDNRVENLQVVTNRFNVCKTQYNYSSKYKGVYWNKQKNKWKSQIRINKKRIHLGYFNCELTASIAYQNKLKTIN